MEKELAQVQCSVCGKPFFMEARFYRYRMKKAGARFACPPADGQKTSDCKRQLQSSSIRKVRGSEESRAKTSAQAKAQWADPKKKAGILSAMKDGMASSEAYATRGARVSATKMANPEACSEAMKRAWDTRGRTEWKRMEFDCAKCGEHVAWELSPSRTKRFRASQHHYCSRMCQATRDEGRAVAEMDTRGCMLCSAEIIRPKAYFAANPDCRGFYCCAAHQRRFISLYGLPAAAIQKIKEFRSTQVFAEKPNKKEQIIIPIVEPLGFQYCGNNSFSVNGLNPDFVNEQKRIVLLHNGCWWHRCPKCYPGRELEIRLSARESFQTRHYSFAGYKTIIIWEHELSDLSLQSNLLSRISAVLPS